MELGKEDQLPLHPRCLPKCLENFPGKLDRTHYLTGQST
jgi:hypothetical protein